MKKYGRIDQLLVSKKNIFALKIKHENPKGWTWENDETSIEEIENHFND